MQLPLKLCIAFNLLNYLVAFTLSIDPEFREHKWECVGGGGKTRIWTNKHECLCDGYEIRTDCQSSLRRLSE